MGSLYKLITKTNLKSPTLAFPLVMPLVFILLYSVNVTGGSIDAMDIAVAGVFTTMLSVTTLQSGLMGFGINFISIKKSVLIRRIGATELKKWEVVAAVVLFGLTLYLITFVWLFIVTILFAAIGLFQDTFKASPFGWITQIQWAKLLLCTLLMLYSSYSLGMLITTISKDDQMYMGIAMMYFFFAGFFGGLMLPNEVPTWMDDIAYIVPHGYLDPLYSWASNSAITISGTTTFIPGPLSETTVGNIAVWEFSLAIVIPVVFGTACMGGAIKLLKFD